MRNLVSVDEKVSDAEDCRQELDLRIGAAFTSFQTMRLNFVPESFWKLKVTHDHHSCKVEFNWKRVRLFHQVAVEVRDFEKIFQFPFPYCRYFHVN